MNYKIRYFIRRLFYLRYKLRRLLNKKILFLGAVIILISLVALTLKNAFSGNKARAVQNQTNKTQEDSRVALPEAKAKVDINRTFTFPLKDQKGKEISKIDYTIINAELQNQIVSNGKNYTTVKGRTILILNLKITNQHDQSIQINSKDYIRLSLNGSPELLAADIHNDPVTVQATSTKYTRLGFPIADSDRNIILQVGEISGSKEAVAINF